MSVTPLHFASVCFNVVGADGKRWERNPSIVIIEFSSDIGV
jgi:hypothetical protein